MRQILSGQYMDVVIRFWGFAGIVGAAEDDCWEWSTDLNKDGYGRFNLGGQKVLAHRFAYALMFGDMPKGLVSDHSCRNRRCVNPWHIEPVTNVENVLRGESLFAQKKRWTHCMRGHLLAGSNLRIRKNGTRFCRACDRDRARQRRGVQ